MAFKILNRVKMTVSGTPGTGTITLGSAVAGFQSFASAANAAVTGDTVHYVLEDGTNWELGTGTYNSTGPTIARTTIIESSSAGAAITASSSAVVYVSLHASDVTSASNANTFSATQTFSAPTTSVALGANGGNNAVAVLYGSTSGSITLKTAAAAGSSINWQWPITNGTNGYALTTDGSGNTSWGQVSLTAAVSGILPVANGGTNASSAGITAFNNITGYTASGATGTTSTNIVFSTSPTITTPTITGYTETAPAAANSGTATTIGITAGTVLRYTMTGNCTFTMPSATTAGQSFIVILTQDATGGRTATFSGVKWPGGSAPSITTTASTGRDILTFVSDGTNWYGTAAQAFA